MNMAIQDGGGVGDPEKTKLGRGEARSANEGRVRAAAAANERAYR